MRLPRLRFAEAKKALDYLRSRCGDVVLHVTGGCCDARTPLCLRADELLIGNRDIVLGVVEGVPIHEMQSTPEPTYFCGRYILEMVPGLPVGFSLNPGNGMRFSIRETFDSAGAIEAAGCCQ